MFSYEQNGAQASFPDLELLSELCPFQICMLNI